MYESSDLVTAGTQRVKKLAWLRVNPIEPKRDQAWVSYEHNVVI